jgi:hypothetical protein
LIREVQDLAFKMPAPNKWTPQFVGMAKAAEVMLNKTLAEKAARTALGTVGGE